MAQKLIALTNEKTVDLLHSDDPAVWNFFGGKPDAGGGELYARVAGAFRGVTRKSRVVSNVPFVILKGKDVVDDSSSWENTLGFMPNPKDLLRRTMQSLIMSNTSYWRMGKNRAGVPKQLHFVMQSSININTDSLTGQLKSLDRCVGNRVEKSYQPDDNELIRFWYLDDKTELLPSPDTEFKSIMNAAGILFFADTFTANFFKNGGIKPTLIAMKGLVSKEKEGELASGWSKFLNGIGFGGKSQRAKIFNAEAMDIKPFGEGLGDLKETPVFDRALADVAIGLGMPLSMLLSNSNNFATASVEERVYLRDEIVPWFDYIADAFNEQLLNPLGYHMENRAELQEPDTGQAATQSQAASAFIDFLNKCSSAEIAIATANMTGQDLGDEMIAAINKFFADKEKNKEKPQEQMRPTEIKPEEKPTNEEQATDEETDEEETVPPVKTWIPTLDEIKDLGLWRDVALRFFKHGDPIPKFEPKHGGLPERINKRIEAALKNIDSIEAIKAAFDYGALGIGASQTPAPVYRTDPAELEAIRLLVQGIGAGVNALKAQPVPPAMTFNLSTTMPEPGAPNVTFSPNILPSPVSVENKVEVNPTPVTVANQNTVNVEPTPITVAASPVTVENQINLPEMKPVIQPSQVVVNPPASARVVRGRDGKIEGLEAT
jgi:hypothetical protein